MDDGNKGNPLDWRVIDWARYPWSKRNCQIKGRVFCDESAKNTDAGNLCLYHYKKQQSCDIDGCHRPGVKFSRDTERRLCRKHMIDDEIGLDMWTYLAYGGNTSPQGNEDNIYAPNHGLLCGDDMEKKGKKSRWNSRQKRRELI